MDSIDVTVRFKVVLDLITKIPEFNGNTNCLVEFLDRVDSIAPILTTFDETTVRMLSGYIRDKIVGKARIELQKHGRIDDWSQLKEILKISFGERLSANKLLDQIRTTRVKTTIDDYYNSLNLLLSRINNLHLINNNRNDQSVISSNNRIALDAFKNNLPEPTKSIILSRNPNTLIEAYKIIREINHQSHGPNGQSEYFRPVNRSSNFKTRQENNNLQSDNINNSNYSGSSNCNNNYNPRNYNNSNNSYSRNNNKYNSRNFNNSNNSFSNQTRQNHNNNSQIRNTTQNQNTNNSQSVNNNNTQSGQSRRASRNGSRNYNNEPMDVSLNEQNNTNNENVNQNRKKFSQTVKTTTLYSCSNPYKDP
ncbi:GATA zinc finger domain-containing protein 4-like [Eupeodes corollae]|uniref:GATA zinc finger domain-containing protein 4-like n=1 Tax=Eupeodes corollae TaxID=290404 RepID=UPI002492CB55|nr:GATA zinc finger domain-containing protein 4-like [Eupeodes corollae]